MKFGKLFVYGVVCCGDECVDVYFIGLFGNLVLSFVMFLLFVWLFLLCLFGVCDVVLCVLLLCVDFL